MSGAVGDVERRSPWLAAIVLLAALAAAGLLFDHLRGRAAARDALPLIDGRIEVAGIDAPVEVLRDGHGIPRIEAASDDDAFFGLGFVHAQDRLGQMLWLRRCARGRTAAVVGRDGLPADRLARTLDFPALAEGDLRRLDAATRDVLAAYARGVNARIARIRSGEADPPLALRNRQSDLDDWTPVDSLAVLKLYAWSLSGTLDVSLVMSDLIEKLGPFAARRFFPGGGGPAGIAPEAVVPIQARAEWAPDPLRRAAGLSGRSIGSSAWVVAGAHAQSGRPLIAADAHLEATAPAMLYIAHLRGDTLRLIGSTLPGLPVVWSGHNGRVAWATTHAHAVVTDVFIETLHRDDAERFHDGSGWRPVIERIETIAVRGAPDEKFTVRSTRHGPLIGSVRDGVREPTSMRWAGARPGNESGVASLLRVARARDAAELLQALAGHEEPVLAVVYADADGAAGLQVAGWIPRRALASGLVPLPGRARWYDWRGRIPLEELPQRRLDANHPFVIAADNPLPASQAGEPIEWLWRSGARADRISARLRAAIADGPLRLSAMAAIQADVHLSRARPLLRAALFLAGPEVEKDAQALEIAELLRGWNGIARADSPEAAAYHVFLAALTTDLLERELGESLLQRYLALPQADPVQAVYAVLRSAAAGGGGDAWSEPAAVGASVRASLREAWVRLSYRLGANRGKWHWGRLHTLRFRPFGPDKAPSSVASSLGPFPYGGSGPTVSTAEFDAAAPFDVRVASTLRMAIDAGALDQLLVSTAPGQSEHPGARHYRDGLESWLHGRAWVLSTQRLLVESGGSQLLLQPAL